MDKQLQVPETMSAADAEALSYLRQAIAAGKHWYLALLEAIGLWTSAEEVYRGRHYRYLIEGEVFDWLVLAERLCETVDALLPVEEKEALLFHGDPPLNLSPEEFKKLIGHSKYHQYLNYFYGITVEEALVLAVEEEVRKERQCLDLGKTMEPVNEACQRIYGETRTALLKKFRLEKSYPDTPVISLMELKEFTYWLFKYRLKYCDPARVASDTRKALEQLKRQQARKGREDWSPVQFCGKI